MLQFVCAPCQPLKTSGPPTLCMCVWCAVQCHAPSLPPTLLLLLLPLHTPNCAILSWQWCQGRSNTSINLDSAGCLVLPTQCVLLMCRTATACPRSADGGWGEAAAAAGIGGQAALEAARRHYIVLIKTVEVVARPRLTDCGCTCNCTNQPCACMQLTLKHARRGCISSPRAMPTSPVSACVCCISQAPHATQ